MQKELIWHNQWLMQNGENKTTFNLFSLVWIKNKDKKDTHEKQTELFLNINRRRYLTVRALMESDHLRYLKHENRKVKQFSEWTRIFWWKENVYNVFNMENSIM